MFAVHTFVGAMWRVGLQARGFAFGMVVLACVFVTLWVSIGASIHKHYETPTPVRRFNPYSLRPILTTGPICLVLVLGQPSLSGRTLGR